MKKLSIFVLMLLFFFHSFGQKYLSYFDSKYAKETIVRNKIKKCKILTSYPFLFFWYKSNSFDELEFNEKGRVIKYNEWWRDKYFEHSYIYIYDGKDNLKKSYELFRGKLADSTIYKVLNGKSYEVPKIDGWNVKNECDSFGNITKEISYFEKNESTNYYEKINQNYKDNFKSREIEYQYVYDSKNRIRTKTKYDNRQDNYFEEYDSLGRIVLKKQSSQNFVYIYNDLNQLVEIKNCNTEEYFFKEKIKSGGSKYYYDEKGNCTQIIKTRTLKIMNLPRKKKYIFKYEYF